MARIQDEATDVEPLVRIADGALSETRPVQPHGSAGATLVFEGIVRGEEAGRPIRALMYEIYEPMASNMLAKLSQEMIKKHGLIAITAEHSRGEIAVGQRSFRLTLQSAHRKEALAAMDEFIDRMKRDVPIWKSPI
ncbi:MAG: molybdenum cofactor biosynthesis protein MoaE [Planctomycetes bacterium]|nr:molybdenum cofactor biosynthesis protein MoaE [Planctomycetota bacterium]